MKLIRVNLDWRTDEYFRDTYTKPYLRVHPEILRYPERYQLVSKYYQLSNRLQKVDFKELPNGDMKVVYKYPAKIDKVLILNKSQARELYGELKHSGYYPKEYTIECYKIR